MIDSHGNALALFQFGLMILTFEIIIGEGVDFKSHAKPLIFSNENLLIGDIYKFFSPGITGSLYVSLCCKNQDRKTLLPNIFNKYIILFNSD